MNNNKNNIRMIAKRDFEEMSNKISLTIENAQKNAVQSINTELVKRNWKIGEHIVEFEQKGEKRAEYGAETLKRLSKELNKKYGKGFNQDNLELFRNFYLNFQKSDTVGRKLSWSNFRILLKKVKDKKIRNFYIIESEKNSWSARQLERQISTSLYERVALSKNKEEILELSKNGNVITKPSDLIKDPLYLEFLDLKEDSSYTESDMEQAIINKLQEFIMELGKGFAFIGRQYKMTIEGTNYYADLVFYNRFLHCFVVIELKVGKLKPEHLGQLNFYVNYFDDIEKTKDENNTIGILVCEEKKHSVVKYALPKESKNIFAVEYKKYLPSEKDLQEKIDEEILKK